MKQINFKIEKTAAEAKTYIEFNSLIEYLKETSKHNMYMYQFWYDEAEIEEDEEAKAFDISNIDAALERSVEDDKIKYEINEQFKEFTKEVNEKGFT